MKSEMGRGRPPAGPDWKGEIASVRDHQAQVNTDHKTQRAKILAVLLRAHGEWVPLYKIAPLACQYGSRIYELRKLGFVIENRTQRRADGVCMSWFRLPLPQQQSLFPNDAAGKAAQ